MEDFDKIYKHEYGTTRGLWCIDKDPNDVSLEWIRENSFTLKDKINSQTDYDNSEDDVAIVRSANIDKLSYTDKTNKLRVYFSNNVIIEYSDVTLATWKEFRSAPSTGSYLNRNITNSYKYTRLQ